MVATLALAALIPAACVLWFMSVAMRNERLAVQQRLAEVYVNHLASLERQVDAFWKERQAAVGSVAGESAMEKFSAVVRGNLADAVVINNDDGKPLYPTAAVPMAAVEQTAVWSAARELEYQKKNYVAAAAAYARIVEASRDIHTKARALQAEATCWLKAGRKMDALARLSQIAGDPTLRNALGAEGTLIAPNAQLLLLKSLQREGSAAVRGTPVDGPGGGEFLAALRQRTLDDLVTRLNDYSGSSLPAAQRRFLMRELISLVPDAELPTHAAEDLAADYLETNAAPPAGPKLQRTTLPGVWQCASADVGMIALYREQQLRADMARILDAAAPPDVSVRLLAPGEPFVASKLVPPHEAGALLPGWRLGLSFRNGDPLAEASARQTRFYLGTGFLVVVFIGVLALLVARTVSAQMRLARLKNELASTVSHELKTPLASMRALVDTLAAGRYRGDRQLRDYLALIAKENQRLSHLIENFLTFSRLDRGRQQFHVESLAPAAIVTAAMAPFQERFSTPECRFEKRIDPDLPCVRGDADALATVLVNLLDNAWKYTDGEKHITVCAYADGRFVCFEIRDNGIGLHAAETRRIFDRFYQVDQSLTRQRGGCGLGLSIVQSIVRAHGGIVEVESEPGNGSTFRVRLPAAPARATETLNTPPSPFNADVRTEAQHLRNEHAHVANRPLLER
jgi:signal transduction histidine kinase